MLKETRIFKELEYLRWVSNVMLVKKACDLARICESITNVNDAYL